ncbi:MAG: hypothetical protein RLZZ165_172, partial [Bacteroidota bacterium]
MTTMKHQAVNWTDGMKLSKVHFIQSDAYHEESMQNLAKCLLRDDNYGLLPPMGGEDSSL